MPSSEPAFTVGLCPYRQKCFTSMVSLSSFIALTMGSRNQLSCRPLNLNYWICNTSQVFVQYSLVSNEADRFMEFSKSSSKILTGPVVVTRNPCLHPGDVRQLTAVSVPQLAHFVDCIVFPNHGPRPHPSEMAGITTFDLAHQSEN